MSGLDLVDEAGNVVRSIRKGSVEAIQAYVEQHSGVFPEEILSVVFIGSRIKAAHPYSSLTDQSRRLIHLKDVIKGGIKDVSLKCEKWVY